VLEKVAKFLKWQWNGVTSMFIIVVVIEGMIGRLLLLVGWLVFLVGWLRSATLFKLLDVGVLLVLMGFVGVANSGIGIVISGLWVIIIIIIIVFRSGFAAW